MAKHMTASPPDAPRDPGAPGGRTTPNPIREHGAQINGVLKCCAEEVGGALSYVEAQLVEELEQVRRALQRAVAASQSQVHSRGRRLRAESGADLPALVASLGQAVERYGASVEESARRRGEVVKVAQSRCDQIRRMGKRINQVSGTNRVLSLMAQMEVAAHEEVTEVEHLFADILTLDDEIVSLNKQLCALVEELSVGIGALQGRRSRGANTWGAFTAEIEGLMSSLGGQFQCLEAQQRSVAIDSEEALNEIRRQVQSAVTALGRQRELRPSVRRIGRRIGDLEVAVQIHTGTSSVRRPGAFPKAVIPLAGAASAPAKGGPRPPPLEAAGGDELDAGELLLF